jgi:16S rRNA (uracil1498-N3)-methyltransferase
LRRRRCPLHCPTLSMTPRLFTPISLAAGATVELDPASAHHAVRVLRLGPGAAVELFDGDGHGAAATLLPGKPARVRVEQLLATEPQPGLRLTLAQCISASEKMDWTIEKAVELGVAALVPLQSRKAIVRLTAERAAKRLEHWQRLILAAAAQSGRKRLPKLEEVTDLGAWLGSGSRTSGVEGDPVKGNQGKGDQVGGDQSLRIVLAPDAPRSLNRILAAHEEEAGTGPSARPAKVEAVCLLCGPESGFSPAEYRSACGAGWQPASLGPRVLRTETAGLAALAVVQARWGDLG